MEEPNIPVSGPIEPEPPPLVPEPPKPPGQPAPPRPPEFALKPPKKSKKGLFVLIFILILLLVPAGLIYATETGYLNIGLDKYYNAIGLEKLWGGLPVSAPKALVVASQKMKGVKSYHFEGSSTLEGIFTQNIPGITKVPQLDQKRVLGESAESTALNLSFAGDFEAPNSTSATISIDLTPSTLPLLNIPNLPASFNIDLKIIGNKTYIKFPNLTAVIGVEATKWAVLDLGQYQPKTLNTYETIIGKQKEYLEIIKSSQRLESEEIKGKAAYHYQMILDKNKLDKLYQNLNALEDPKLDIWIAKKDHLILRIKFEANLNIDTFSINAKSDFSFTDFDKKFGITAPKAEEIAKGGLLEMMTSAGLGGAQEKARDATRKSDLKQIKTALEAYKDDKGSYPVSKEIDKTNNEKGVLNKALVPKYLKKLPIDPNDPINYYGFISDGKTFQLTCVLEDKTDPDGKQMGNYFIYTITND